MLTTEQLTVILLEVLTEKPPTLTTDEALEFREELQKSVDEIVAKGGTVDLPFEIPGLP